MQEKERIGYMRKALQLAVKGSGWVTPNPMVGGVIVKNGQIIGRGYHQRFGEPHAEINALADCTRHNHDPRDAVMFVTLEPCCHHGKTPPCTEAIIQAGIMKVEIATLDVSEKVSGRGAQQLRDKGIEVTVGCCEADAQRLNAGFFKWIRTSRPRVILKWAQSKNHKLAWGKDLPQRWITNEKSRRHVHKIRRLCGAILVGINTVLADDPLLTIRLSGRQPKPLRVVLDSSLQLPIGSKLALTAAVYPTVVYTLAKSMQSQWEKVDALSEMAVMIVPVEIGSERVELNAVLEDLGRRGVTDLLVEGGAAVLKAFWQAKLADKVMIYTAPAVIDEENVPAIEFADELGNLKNTHKRRFGEDVLLEGEID